MNVNLEKLNSMQKPIIKISLTFFFKKEFKKEEIENAIELKSHNCVLCKDAKISPITKEKVDGHISFFKIEQEIVNSSEPIEKIINYLYNFKDNINKINSKFDGRLQLALTSYLTSLKTPYLILTNEIIKKMAELNISFTQNIDLIEN